MFHTERKIIVHWSTDGRDEGVYELLESAVKKHYGIDCVKDKEGQ